MRHVLTEGEARDGFWVLDLVDDFELVIREYLVHLVDLEVAVDRSGEESVVFFGDEDAVDCLDVVAQSDDWLVVLSGIPHFGLRQEKVRTYLRQSRGLCRFCRACSLPPLPRV